MLVTEPLGFFERQRLSFGVPALRKIPDPVAPPAPDDSDDATVLQQLEHDRDIAGAPPRVLCVALLRRTILELASEHRTASLELAHDVTPEGRVLLEEGHTAPLPLVFAGAASAHVRADHRQ